MTPEKRLQLMCDMMELSAEQAGGIVTGLVIGMTSAQAHPEIAKRFLEWAFSDRPDRKRVAEQAATIIPFIVDGIEGLGAVMKP